MKREQRFVGVEPRAKKKRHSRQKKETFPFTFDPFGFRRIKSKYMASLLISLSLSPSLSLSLFVLNNILKKRVQYESFILSQWLQS